MNVKILFITSESVSDPKRGTPIRIFNFLKQIALGHSLWLSSNDKPGTLDFKRIEYPKGFWKRIAYYRKVIEKEKIDIVMTATDIGLFEPIVLKLLSKVKIAVDLHGLYAMEMYEQGHMGKIKSFLLQKKINFQLRFYDLIFTVSEKLKNYYNFIHGKREVIYGGVTENEFYKGPVVAPSVFTLGYTGNAKPYQGIDTFLQVASQIRKENLFEFRLNMIMSSGRGEIEDRLKRLNLFDIADLNYKVSHDEVPALIAKSSVLVLARPSINMTEYAYPSKLPEYLATGIPVVTTRVGPVDELFQSSETMVIIEAENAEEDLKEALVRLNKLSEEERKNIGDRAKVFVRENLMWDVLGKKINSSLERI